MNKKQIVHDLEQVLQKIEKAHKDAKLHKIVNPGDMRATRIKNAIQEGKRGLTGVVKTIKNKIESEQQAVEESFNEPSSSDDIDEKASEQVSEVENDGTQIDSAEEMYKITHFNDEQG